MASATVKIQGRDYTPVAERVRLAHAAGGFEMTSSELIQVGDRWLAKVTILVGGHRFIGHAEVHLTGAKPGTADASSPFETAETSALGRALGFAGFGSAEAIASADWRESR